MKVVVVSTPRTCSSYVAEIFQRRYNLVNKSEIISSCNSIDDVLETVKSFHEEDDFVVKITTTSLTMYFDTLNYLNFPWNIFDKIVLAERQIIENQYASWLLLNLSQVNNHRNIFEVQDYITNFLNNRLDSYELDMAEFKNVHDNISYYYTTLKPHLLNSELPVYIAPYELLQNEPSDYIDKLNELLGESFTLENLDTITKNAIDYSPFVQHINLKQLIENMNNAE